MTEYAVICADEFGVTIEGTDPDPEVLIEKFSAAARQEFTHWPELEPIPYMLIMPEEVPLARALEESTAKPDSSYLGPEPAERLVAELGSGTVVRPDEVEHGDRVRVPGWANVINVVGHEVKERGWVMVMWEGPNMPGPYTMFRHTERIVRL